MWCRIRFSVVFGAYAYKGVRLTASTLEDCGISRRVISCTLGVLQGVKLIAGTTADCKACFPQVGIDKG